MKTTINKIINVAQNLTTKYTSINAKISQYQFTNDEAQILESKLNNILSLIEIQTPEDTSSYTAILVKYTEVSDIDTGSSLANVDIVFVLVDEAATGKDRVWIDRRYLNSEEDNFSCEAIGWDSSEKCWIIGQIYDKNDKPSIASSTATSSCDDEQASIEQIAYASWDFAVIGDYGAYTNKTKLVPNDYEIQPTQYQYKIITNRTSSINQNSIYVASGFEIEEFNGQYTHIGNNYFSNNKKYNGQDVKLYCDGQTQFIGDLQNTYFIINIDKDYMQPPYHVWQDPSNNNEYISKSAIVQEKITL